MYNELTLICLIMYYNNAINDFLFLLTHARIHLLSLLIHEEDHKQNNNKKKENSVKMRLFETS